MKIAILGTRGVPNRYGGFEQFAEYLSAGLARKGHNVSVYNSHKHPFQEKTWNGVNIIHCYDPEHKIGTAGQFIYDFNCILDARKRGFDAILMLGYTSSSVWSWLYPRKSAILFNMDGLEWKRTKYSEPVKKFLLYAEKLATRSSKFLIADSLGIQSYLKDTYGVASEYIPYGAEIIEKSDDSLLQERSLQQYEYFMLMARMEPENNIEMILDGLAMSDTARKMVVIGNAGNKFGSYLVHKYKNDPRIVFAGAIYDAAKLDGLKRNARIYFHGHSVGGTNPSLLEAMASQALMAAHDNPFNKTILQQDAFYFSDAAAVSSIVSNTERGEQEIRMIANNFQKIKEQFSWSRIIDQYEAYILNCIPRK